MKKEITYGAIDLLHTVYLNILNRLNEKVDALVVAISSDELNTFWKKVSDVNKHDIYLFVLGDSWKTQFDYLKEYCEIIYLSQTTGFSTTRIIKDLNEIAYV